MFVTSKKSGSFAIRSLFIAAVAAVPLLMSGAPEAHAAACLDDVTHWGKVSQTKWQARDAARDGMRWKINHRLSESVVIQRGTRIQRCKFRDNGYNYGWQCQAAIVVNVCQ